MPDIPRSRTWLLLAGTIVLQVAIIRSATVLRHGLTPPSANPNPSPGNHLALPLRRGADVEMETQTFLSLPYHEWYAASPTYLKPLIAFGYLLLLSFLFSFIGIVASDFFCPNLATIANYLGLSETTAGVTFLAFGNGSPDVFSTFSAMNQGTFSLAIGELIGAATFITSIVVGSIAFIRPFYVPKTAFIRDISFFTVAVVVLVLVLRDGHLSLIESTVMVALYALYVVVVITMNVLARRRRRPELLEEEEEHAWKSLPGSRHVNGNGSVSPMGTVDDGTPTPRPSSLHLPSPHLEAPPTPDHDDASSAGSLTPTGIRSRRRSRSHSHAHLHMQFHGLSTPDYAETPRANFSLLGAIEFRDVVNSLKKENASRTPSPSRSPYTAIERTDYFSAVTGPGHGHRRSISQAAGNRRSSVQAQYRSRAISHVVQPGSMATFSMTPTDLSPSPKRISPIRTTSAPGHPHFADQTDDRPRTKLSSNKIITTAGPAGEQTSSSSLSPTPSPENPWKDQTGNPPALPPPRPALPKLDIPEPLLPKRRHGATPSISIMDPSGHVEEPIFSPPQDESSPPRQPSPSGSGESRFRIRRRTRMILRVLFPSLQSFRHKSLFGQFLSVFSVPAIFVLTLTLPVVDDGGREEGGIALPVSEDEPMVPDLEPGLGQSASRDEEEDRREAGEEEDPFLRPDVGEGLHHLVESGFSPLHSPLGRIHHSVRRVSEAAGVGVSPGEEDVEITKEILEELEQEEALDFNKPLCAAQCIFGPTFCAYIVFGDFEYGAWVVLACLGLGVVAALGVQQYGTDGTSRSWRMVRCMAGFTCSMVWIAAIADEVVSVLQSIGELMGLSDAIIGLTIFAIGNSMADLVANITVAQFAPAMAYAACFGGPMLNLLLGVGGSGTYHLLFHPHRPVKLHFSPTLWVSATGLIIILLTTAVVVPLNGYLIDRRWAACLVLAYGTLMVANVAVEIKTGRA